MNGRTAAPPLKVLFVEPFYGGSHRLFADRYAALSSHRVRLLTLPGSFWKWRMRGGHLSLADAVRREAGDCDRLLVSDMLSLAELMGMVPELERIPKTVYFHENQLSYPVPRGESPDVHFGFTNLSTAFAADALVFNSRFHRDAFLGGIDRFLSAMPDHRPRRLADALEGRAAVIYPGIDCAEADRLPPRSAEPGPPTILWNHRWEFDKQPEVFFRALEALVREGLDFRVHLAGENFQAQPQAFLDAREFLGERLGRFGFVPERTAYLETLRESDVVVSTASQEFFGIAVMEAACCGCRPLLPRRLVYPELYGEEFLYDGEEELREKLHSFVTGGLPSGPWRSGLREEIARRFDVRTGVAALDRLLADL